MNIDIPILKIIIKPVLWLTKFFNDDAVVLVCRGYGDDWEYYTGLYWDEDNDANFNEYKDFRLWLKF
jgi:hypothetical protein